MGWTDDPDAALVRAEGNGRKALSIDDNNLGAHVLLGRIYIFRGEYDQALDELRRAVDINPSDPEAQSGLADVLLWSGDPMGAIKALRDATRVQPILSAADSINLGAAYILVDRPRDAIATMGRAVQRYDQNPYVHAMLAGAYAAVGQMPDADAEAGIVKRLLPSFAAKDFATQLRDQGQRSKLVATLQQAGL